MFVESDVTFELADYGHLGSVETNCENSDDIQYYLLINLIFKVYINYQIIKTLTLWL